MKTRHRTLDTAKLFDVIEDWGFVRHARSDVTQSIHQRWLLDRNDSWRQMRHKDPRLDRQWLHEDEWGQDTNNLAVHVCDNNVESRHTTRGYVR